MSEEKDLKRMFEAQRECDQAQSPTFDDILAAAHSNPGLKLRSTSSIARSNASFAVAAIALVLLIGFTTGIISRPTDRDESAALESNMQHLSRTCDALLVTIGNIEPETIYQTTDFQNTTTRQTEMDWQTVSDSLIPFDTLSFNVRTSP